MVGVDIEGKAFLTRRQSFYPVLNALGFYVFVLFTCRVIQILYNIASKWKNCQFKSNNYFRNLELCSKNIMFA